MRLLNEGFPLHLNSGFWGCDSISKQTSRESFSAHLIRKRKNKTVFRVLSVPFSPSVKRQYCFAQLLLGVNR